MMPRFDIISRGFRRAPLRIFSMGCRRITFSDAFSAMIFAMPFRHDYAIDDAFRVDAADYFYFFSFDVADYFRQISC